MARPGRNPVQITVSFDGRSPQVDKPNLTMTQEADEVVFVPSSSAPNFDVHFETTPFEGDHFHSHTPNANRTGAFDPSKHGRHKYNVVVNGATLDPVIIVNP